MNVFSVNPNIRRVIDITKEGLSSPSPFASEKEWEQYKEQVKVWEKQFEKIEEPKIVEEVKEVKEVKEIKEIKEDLKPV